MASGCLLGCLIIRLKIGVMGVNTSRRTGEHRKTESIDEFYLFRKKTKKT